MKKVNLIVLCAVMFVLLIVIAAFADDVIYSNGFTPYPQFVGQASSAQNQKAVSADEKKQEEAKAMKQYFDKLKVSITPYMFFFAMDAGVEVGDMVSNSVLSPDKVRSILNSQTNVRFDINKANWGFFLDTSNMAFSKSASVTKLQSDFSMNAAINHYCAYYRCDGNLDPIVDIYAGVRTYSFNTDLTLKLGGLPLRSILSTNAWTDPIIGMRVTKPLLKHLAVTVGADGGGFSGIQESVSAYALFSWEIASCLSVNGGYEYLKFKKCTSEATIPSTFNMTAAMYGPVASISLNF